ncbi:MAG: hypothetical protein KDC44_05655 [Phaeodactylibacter sp.]|nr:hypothetical protein [Phaeodactylibacter sp.]
MTTNSSNNNSKQRLIAIAAVIVVALLAVNAYLLYNKFAQDKKIEQQAASLDESEQLKAELEKQYYESLSELEEMRGTNEELNMLIEEQQTELKASKDRIDNLIRNEKDLKRARTELNSLRGQVEQYLAEIQTLKEENNLLTNENEQLNADKQMLTSDLESSRENNEALTAEKAMLVSEKTDLEASNRDLTKTVNYASVVKVKNLDVTGMKMKGSGKYSSTKSAKNVDLLQVCFETTVNEVTKPGREQFMVRIINPVGETMAIEEMGSGTFTNSSTNQQIRYTQIKEYDYANDESELCFEWDPNVPFQSGTYTVEIYNKGFTAGSSTFELK